MTVETTALERSINYINAALEDILDGEEPERVLRAADFLHDALRLLQDEIEDAE